MNATEERVGRNGWGLLGIETLQNDPCIHSGGLANVICTTDGVQFGLVLEIHAGDAYVEPAAWIFDRSGSVLSNRWELERPFRLDDRPFGSIPDAGTGLDCRVRDALEPTPV